MGKEVVFFCGILILKSQWYSFKWNLKRKSEKCPQIYKNFTLISRAIESLQHRYLATNSVGWIFTISYYSDYHFNSKSVSSECWLEVKLHLHLLLLLLLLSFYCVRVMGKKVYRCIFKAQHSLRAKKFQSAVNPLHPNIRIYTLHTVLYTFLKVLTRRIWFALVGDHFLSSHDFNIWFRGETKRRN